VRFLTPLGATGLEDMTVDEVILGALERGQPVTANDVTMRFLVRVRRRLEKLRVRGVVVREGRGGRNREFTYRLVRPDRMAEAISEKGGGLSGASKREKNMAQERNASV
jgi:predicted ArsR family transcriptional regulator